MDIETRCKQVRSEIKSVSLAVLSIRDSAISEEPKSTANPPEMIANAMLAYRHLEDARMRLGKVIEAHDGGASCYDK